MGMLATVINSICLKDALIRAGADAVVMAAVSMSPFADLYSAEKAISALESGKIVIFGGGDPLINPKGKIIGGLGVSGGSEEQDIALSEFGKKYFETKI
jgi:uncharacterized protein GlcG (DUF336 family)